MRVQKQNPWLTGLGVVLAVFALTAGRAAADVASDQAGSIVIFPKVIADGTRDTLISLSNTSNMPAYVHCEYVQGAGICQGSPAGAPTFCTPINAQGASPDCALGVPCEVAWQSQNFDLILTRQQPTIWRVSTGRIFDPFAPANGECENVMQGGIERQICPGLFITEQSGDPNNPTGNLIPPPGAPFFRGELKCFQVDSTLTSLNAGNALKGEAILGWDPDSPLASANISTYNSINIQAENGSPDDLLLKLDDTPNRPSDDRGEYNACPEAIEFTNFSPGASNPVAEAIAPAACTGSGCPVRTEITVIPCSEDFENEVGTRTTIQFQFYDEFENLQNSATRELDCWANYDLAELSTQVNSSTYWKTRITPSSSSAGRCREGLVGEVCSSDSDCDPDGAGGANGVCGPSSGILAVVEQFYDSDASLASVSPLAPGSSAVNTVAVNDPGQGPDTDAVRSGRCRGNLSMRCEKDGDCPDLNGAPTGDNGICRNSDTFCSTDDDCTGAAGLAVCDICMNDEIRFNQLQ
jgi:hypothetical protein